MTFLIKWEKNTILPPTKYFSQEAAILLPVALSRDFLGKTKYRKEIFFANANPTRLAQDHESSTHQVYLLQFDATCYQAGQPTREYRTQNQEASLQVLNRQFQSVFTRSDEVSRDEFTGLSPRI